MKYSIRGEVFTNAGEPIIADINSFTLWRLVTDSRLNEEEKPVFTFEVWLNSLEDKTRLFNLLKLHVDNHTGQIDWHDCSHDQELQRPCVIAETYRGR